MLSNEQSWLALHYVLGELSDAERDSFEQRLASDSSLCEEVAAASQLVLTAKAALRPEVTLASPERNRPAGRHSWLAVAATSVSVAMLGVFALQIPLSTHRPIAITQHDPVAAELVSLWQSSGDDAEADDSDSELSEGPGDVSIPGWMLAAVSLEIGEDPNDKVQEN